MSQQMPPQPEQPSLPPPLWATQPPPPPTPSVWSRVAAWVVLVAVVAAGAGAGVGFGLARAITSQNIVAQPFTPATSPLAPASPATGSNGNSDSTNLDAIAAAVRPSIVDINT